jgi:hypothetical protein
MSVGRGSSAEAAAVPAASCAASSAHARARSASDLGTTGQPRPPEQGGHGGGVPLVPVDQLAEELPVPAAEHDPAQGRVQRIPYRGPA